MALGQTGDAVEPAGEVRAEASGGDRAINALGSKNLAASMAIGREPLLRRHPGACSSRPTVRRVAAGHIGVKVTDARVK